MQHFKVQILLDSMFAQTNVTPSWELPIYKYSKKTAKELTNFGESWRQKEGIKGKSKFKDSHSQARNWRSLNEEILDANFVKNMC